MHNFFTQAEGVANLDKVPEAGALIAIGFAKPEGGTGGYARYIAIGFAKPEGGTGGYARYIAIAPKDWPYGVSVIEAPGAPLPKQPYPLRRNTQGVLVPTKP